MPTETGRLSISEEMRPKAEEALTDESQPPGGIYADLAATRGPSRTSLTFADRTFGVNGVSMYVNCPPIDTSSPIPSLVIQTRTKRGCPAIWWCTRLPDPCRSCPALSRR